MLPEIDQHLPQLAPLEILELAAAEELGKRGGFPLLPRLIEQLEDADPVGEGKSGGRGDGLQRGDDFLECLAMVGRQVGKQLLGRLDVVHRMVGFLADIAQPVEHGTSFLWRAADSNSPRRESHDTPVASVWMER
jgi:hypothetical protein